MKGMGLRPLVVVRKPAARAAAKPAAAPRMDVRKPVRTPKVPTSKRSKIPTTPARATVKKAPSKGASRKPVAESPAPPPAPSVVLGQAPRIKPIVDRRLGYGAVVSRVR